MNINQFHVVSNYTIQTVEKKIEMLDISRVKKIYLIEK